MGRMGSSSEWDDARDGSGPRSRRGTPDDGERRHDDGRGRSRLSSSQVASALREAQQLQQDGHLEDAIQLCEELLDSGVDRSDVHYFLGWLYQEADRWDEAAARFELLLNDPDYALSCYYALGQCSRAEGRIEDAAHYFDEAVDRVNLDALTHDESDQLIQLCQEAAEAHREMNDLEGAETVYTALLGFLRSQGWQDQVVEVERQMRETLGTAPPPQRRRRNADPSRPVGSNIPQRGGRAKGAGGQDMEAPPPVPDPAASQPSAHMPVAPSETPPAGMSGQMPIAPGMPPQAPMVITPEMAAAAGYVPASPTNGFSNGMVPGMGLAGMPPMVPGGGMGAMAGAAQYYSSQLPPATASDPLSQLISNLAAGGIGGARIGVNSLPEPQRSQVAQAIHEIENYVAHGLLTAAIEGCLHVMEVAPQFLDVHLMLGEIYVRQGKIEQAIAKYTILIDTYLVNGRLDDAIATYRRILQLEPNNLTFRVKLIELLNKQGRTDEVLQERLSAADSYLRLGYADRAIQEYEQALLSNPNNTALRLNYAQALMKAGRAAQAVAEYQRILQTDPGNVKALTQWQIALATGIGASPAASMPGTGSTRVAALEVLTRLLRVLRSEHMRGYEDMTREYMQALEQGPVNPDLRYALGQIHLAANHTQEALTCFQQVAATPGFEVLARVAAAQALLLAGDAASATSAAHELEDAAAAVRISPPEPMLWMARPRLNGEEALPPDIEISSLLARAYQASGQVAKAQQAMPRTSQQAPVRSGEVYQALAEVQARQSDPQATLQEYAQLVRHYRGNRQVENAVTVLKEMARVAPDDPAVHTELADIHVSRGLLDEGVTELRQLADIHTRRGQLRDAALVYQRMAEISWGMDNFDEALTLLKQAVQYATDDMSIRQQLVQYCLVLGPKDPVRMREATEQQTVIARYYFASRQTKEAVAALQQLIGMDTHNYEAYDLLGQTYYSVGEYEQAARVYRNLAKVDPTSQMARARLAELQAVRAQMR
ncbi:MAG TPA: tetratricopeptide repeat protein [Ktedonobacterales bacterium]|nr:tetratricopeptide repeat protein [Ktedonobacterales bacterium]